MKPTELKIGQKYKIIFPAHIKKWMIDNKREYPYLAFYIENIQSDGRVVTIIKQVPGYKNWFCIDDDTVLPKNFFHSVDASLFYSSLRALIDNEK